MRNRLGLAAGTEPVIHYMTTMGVGGAWVANELRVLKREGIPFTLHSLRKPDMTFYSAEDIATFDRETRTLYPLKKALFLKDLALAPFYHHTRFFAALWNALTGKRETPRARIAGIWHLALACHWVASLRNQPVTHIHSQWAHSGATVAMYGAWLLNKPFSFTGHAVDLFRDRAALSDKIKRADFIVCISEFHRQFFLENGAREDQLFIAYCGIDTSLFTPSDTPRDADAPFHILSSGRLVEKKGFAVLIEACRLLKERGTDVRCTIVGSGPLEDDLRAAVHDAELDEAVTLTGKPIAQEDLPDFMASGDVYCLPCVWAKDNDVDGLPMMLMEATACGLPAVSTRLVGIPDLIRDGETGLLVNPEDAAALADALQRLAGDRALGARLAKAGRTHVLDRFNIETCLEPLVSRYRAALEKNS